VPARLALVALLACFAPGCVSALVGVLGGDARSMKAATDADLALWNATVRRLASSGGAAPPPSPRAAERIPASGGEPDFVCDIPGEDEPQSLAASSTEGAVRTCEAMNALPAGGHCACRETQLESAASLGAPTLAE
jgi:hypothetical protein